jgi:cytochrome c-type biogenesis protein CcmH
MGICVCEGKIKMIYVSLALFLAVVIAAGCYPLYHTRGKKFTGFVAGFLVVSSVGLYALFGSPQLVEPVAKHHADVQALRDMIVISEELIKENPSNLEAWLNLAQAFADSGQYKQAANAYKQCVLLSKGNPLLIMAYAEALIAANNGVVGADAKKSIDIALMIDKKMPVARYYNAIWMLQNEQTAKAMETMKTLYHELPEDSKLKRKINEQIGR